MKIEHFYEFATLAETLNFRRAAAALFITQPTLSAHIRALEGDLGVELFERDTHTVRLTETGAHVLAEARGLIDAYERVKSAATHAGGKARATVRLAAPLRFRSTAQRVTRLFSALREMNAKFTLRAIDLGMQDIPELLENDRCDIVLSHYAPEYNMGMMRCAKLYDTSADAWVSTRNVLARRKSVELSELNGMVYRPPVSDLANPLAQQVLNSLEQRGVTPEIGQPLDDQGNLDERDFCLVFGGEEPSGTFGLGACRLALQESISLSSAVTCRRDSMDDPSIKTVLELLGRQTEEKRAQVKGAAEHARG